MKEKTLSNQLHGLIEGMKRFNYYHCVLLIATLAWTALSGCESNGAGASAGAATAAPAVQGGGQLIVRRSPTMGTNLVLDVSVDGALMGSVSEGQTFRRSLAPGTHVVSVLLRPNGLNLQPTKKTITIAKGQTYALDAEWRGETLVLR
jgi:hypothetical protein